MNKVILIGRLTKDPELRYTANNTAQVSFNIAVDRRMKQEGQPSADFINTIAWSKTAEFVNNYFKKGNKIGVCGRIQTRTWDDADNKKHYVTEVVAEEAYFVESKGGNTQGGQGESFTRSNSINDVSPSSGYFPIDDDGDIPF
jgi:single-strand DNA-binding protein